MDDLRIVTVPVTPFQQNCTLLIDTASSASVIVDPGGDVARILAALEKEATDAVAIWLTHGHIDHAGGAAELAEALNRRPGHAPVEIIGPDRRDEPLLQSLVQQAALFRLTGARNVTPTRYLQENDALTIGPHRFDVLHCPGHTPGHVVFVNRAARFAHVGDVLFRGSVGRTDFPYSDHAALIAAIKTKLLPLGDDFSFICGHGPGSTIGVERRANPFIQ
jgi:glyoxylase-like metal-dependent hydrolase (beta-lactamase superfamily II)